jgi:hypothetical protein
MGLSTWTDLQVALKAWAGPPICRAQGGQGRLASTSRMFLAFGLLTAEPSVTFDIDPTPAWCESCSRSLAPR